MTATVTGSPRRRQVIRDRGLNGIDRVGVSDDRRSILLTLLRPIPDEFDESWIDLLAASGTTPVRQVGVRLPEADDFYRDHGGDRSDGRSIWIELNHAADARGGYRLRVKRPGDPTGRAPRGFDPRSCEISVDFAAGCSSGLDCLPISTCPPELLAEPALSYLAKDYRAFRQLLLDRLALIMPGWKERHAPDLQLTLVELLAYVGDQLSYFQDAVATEAYLQTARKRTSVRRHARLVDYLMHEGCNARAWVTITVSGSITLRAEEFRFIAGSPDGPGVVRYDPGRVVDGRIFEPMLRTPVRLRPWHNEIAFWAWGAEAACLPVGCTSATLVDGWADVDPAGGAAPAGVAPPAGRRSTQRRARLLDLEVGDVLVIKERLGVQTGRPADADPSHRQAVRLTSVAQSYDVVFEQPVVDVGWADCDALTFAACVATTGPDCRPLGGVSVACGNVVLVDHGRSIHWCGSAPEPVDVPPRPAATACCDPCGPTPELPGIGWGTGSSTRAPWRPPLATPGLTFAEAYPRPEELARAQGTVLRSIPKRMQGWLRDLLTQNRALQPGDLDDLETVFGANPLDVEHPAEARSAGDFRGGGPRRLAALEYLLSRWDRLLENKIRRLARVADRACDGYVLDAGAVAVIAQEWGSRWLGELDPASPALHGPACHALVQNPRRALPELTLTDGEVSWRPVPDLLTSGPNAHDVVVEIDDERIARLRFGDGECGAMPDAGHRMQARYRVGGGAAGNVGAGVINRMECCGVPPGEITSIGNPLPATGGVDPESVDQVRRDAPYAFADRPQRAVTAADYASFARQHAAVQSTAATLSWTGSWYEADVVVDPRGSELLRPELRVQVAADLHRYRRIGHDVRVSAAEPVALDLSLKICVRPDCERGEIARAVLDELGTGLLADGRAGFFAPDELVIGAPVFLSRIVARVAGLPGVQSVVVLRFERFGHGDRGELDLGVLRPGPRQLVRLDNDPLRPDNGVLALHLVGGR